MSRNLFAIVFAIVLCVQGVAHAGIGDDVVWSGIGGPDGDWTGNLADGYATGGWTSPAGVPGLSGKTVFAHPNNPCCPLPTGNIDRTDFQVGTGELGTDVFISNGGVVTYNPNAHIIPPNTATTKFRDFTFNTNASFPGHGRLYISNGSTLQMETGIGGDADGEWTRWNGAELNLDNGTFRRTADESIGNSGGAFMLASYGGYINSVQTVTLTNGGRIENEGQLWFGISGNNAGTENKAGIRLVMTINNGHLDLTGGDDWALDNDALEMRADLAFIYDWKADADPTNDEFIAINFTGPGTITVDGENNDPVECPDESCVAAGAGRGGIRVATNTTATIGEPSNYGTDKDTQRSYQDLWNLGILRAHNLSGLTGANFNDYFTVANNPGDNDYKLTSIVTPVAPNGKSKGDYNNNGTVDAADYVIYRATLGSTTDLRADGDGSLNINEADLVPWRDNFGTTGLPTFGSGTGAAVPEPGTALLVMFGLASLWLFKRK